MVTREDLASLIKNKEFMKMLLRVAYGFTRRTELAEDIVYESLTEMFEMSDEYLATIRDIYKFSKTIVFRVAIREAGNSNNTRIKLPAGELPEDDVSIDPLAHLSFKEMRKAIKDNMKTVDLLIFDLRSQGYSYKEIGFFVEESEAYVRRRMFETRNWLNNNNFENA